MKFQDKVVVITGASRGIGKATAKAFADNGAKLVLAYHEQHELMKSLAQELSTQTEVEIVAGYIAQKETAVKIYETTLRRFGRADVLVNNAGAILGHGEITPSDFDAGMRTNLLGVMMMTQAFTPALKQQSGANIINVSSTFGIMGAAAVAVYTAAKAGIINYTKSMAVDLAPHIRVNALAPGIIDTDMTAGAGEELTNYFISRTPMNRLGTPEEMARAILFLASDEASFVTGHTLIADGGHILMN